MAVMVITCLSIILYASCEIRRHKFFYITAASTDYLDPLSLENILSSLSHIAGKHHGDTHLSQHRSYPTLAATSFRGGHLADTCHLVVNDIKYRIICTMTEVVIYVSVSCRYRYFHKQKSKIRQN